jgi:PRC-barrel domain
LSTLAGGTKAEPRRSSPYQRRKASMLKSISLALPIVALASGAACAAQTSSLATPDHWLASDVYKASVYSPAHKKIGDIDDLVMTSSGQVKIAVIGVGGFLGVGQKDVAVPFTDLKVVAYKGTEELTLDRTKDQLKKAPSYDKTKDETSAAATSTTETTSDNPPVTNPPATNPPKMNDETTPAPAATPPAPKQ